MRREVPEIFQSRLPGNSCQRCIAISRPDQRHPQIKRLETKEELNRVIGYGERLQKTALSSLDHRV